MARLRVGGDVVEVGVDELAMKAPEARRLLDGAGVHINDAALDRLLERTEGWPVGLYLAALALQAGGSQDHAGLPFSGDDRLMADYLQSELLSLLSPAEVAFLTRTAILDRLSGPLCDAVLGTHWLGRSAGVARTLEPVARRPRPDRPSGIGTITCSETSCAPSCNVVSQSSSTLFMSAPRSGTR